MRKIASCDCGHSWTSHQPKCPCGCKFIQPYARKFYCTFCGRRRKHTQLKKDPQFPDYLICKDRDDCLAWLTDLEQ